MQVRMTAALKEALERVGLDADQLLADFAEWKAGDEYAHFFFGKDGAYLAPKINGEYALMHVHLVPLVDLKNLREWKAAHKRGSRKTSDRVLVYVTDKRYGHLLIFILDEPIAHRIAKRQTVEDRETMDGFAVVAEEFFFSGSILG